ncbi:hypothetical protein [Pollutibacter soli]|uniref:hypothetical protein n=1 Tax=Pollutibacter soli TaxID=3034157 RepID=UPI00301371B6
MLFQIQVRIIVAGRPGDINTETRTAQGRGRCVPFFFLSAFLLNFISKLFMSKEEIKAEINRVLDNLSDKTLAELLSYLKDIDSKNNEFLNVGILNKILSEDKSLLAKLAK